MTRFILYYYVLLLIKTPMMMKNILLFVTTIFLATSCCGNRFATSEPSPGKLNTMTAEKLIMAIPAWTKGYGSAQQAAFDSLISRLRSYTNAEIATAVEHIVSNNRIDGLVYLDNMSRIYIAIRALYEVPASVPSSEAVVFGGWARPPEEPAGTYSPLWPLQKVKGRLLVTGSYAGYAGIDYDAVGECKYFSSKYPRREK